MTSSWSIVERSASRLVAQAKPYRVPSHWSANILKALVVISAYCPGGAAVVNGSNFLPVTGICHINKIEQGVMDCVETYSLWGRVVKRDRFQLEEIVENQLERQEEGDPRLFITGLLWLAGVTASLAFFKARQIRKNKWTFTASGIQQQPLALLPRKLRKFEPAHSLQLEIPNIDLSKSILEIIVRWQPVDSPATTNLQRPEIYRSTYHELAQVLESVMKPISELLDLPCQLIFQQQQERYAVDFIDRAIQKFYEGEAVAHIAFDDIIGCEIEVSALPPLTGSEFLRTDQKSICYLTLELANGDRHRLHEYAGYAAIYQN
jgi:hypothetical protein